jgi:hypothetical protein
MGGRREIQTEEGGEGREEVGGRREERESTGAQLEGFTPRAVRQIVNGRG